VSCLDAAAKAEPPSDQEPWKLIAEAMADLVRGKIFRWVADARFLDGTVTVNHVAEGVREPRRRVRYHLDVLSSQGLVEVVEEGKRRGARERHYRASRLPLVPTSELGVLTPAQQKAAVLDLLRAMFAEAVSALASGGFVRRPEWVLARLPARVDEQGWQELSSLHEMVADQAVTIVEGAQERLKSQHEMPIEIMSSVLFYERNSGSEPESDS
jgi:DNA-binding transcriptional ArsR family regulator